MAFEFLTLAQLLCILDIVSILLIDFTCCLWLLSDTSREIPSVSFEVPFVCSCWYKHFTRYIYLTKESAGTAAVKGLEVIGCLCDCNVLFV